jgi:UPF0755 protein
VSAEQFKLDWKAAAALAAALFVLLGLIQAAVFLTSPAGPTGSVIVRVYPGASLARVAEILEERGAVTSARKFVWLARLTGKGSRIKAGEYDLNPALKPGEILDMLAEGKVRVHQLTIPEGYTAAQVAAALEQADLADAKRFLAVCAKNPALAAELGVEGDDLEGYLYPDTYNIAFYMTEEAIARVMVRRFLSVWARHAEEAKAKGMSMREVVILASIIEKETSRPEERRLIAAVFHNRLNQGMRLQSDPTVIYGLAGAYDGDLKRSHLRSSGNPYNTYRLEGLPPGPIGNPGEESIRAALSPAHCNYLYFVSRNDGSHKFSATLTEHNAAVRLFQCGGGGGGTRPPAATVAPAGEGEGAHAEEAATEH